MIKGKFSQEEKALFDNLEASKQAIQSEVDKLNAMLKDENKTLKEHRQIRAKIADLRPKMVPFAQMQAALASPLSRDKYFPDFSKNQFIEHVKKQVK